jgi:polyisoprenoid-binding protein YceI
LAVEFGGIVIDPYGQTKAGFTVTGKISRKAFGLTWSAITEAGNIVLGDEIKINAEVQLVKQA